MTLSDPGQYQVTWGDDDEKVVTLVPDGLCDSPHVQIDTDFESGLVVISTDSDGAVVRPNDIQWIDELGDLVAWDSHTQMLYAANSGDTRVRGHRLDGALLWQTDVGDTVVSLDDMGPHGAAMVMVEAPNGTGKVLVLDGVTGDVRSETPAPSAAKLHVADNGKIAAMILQDTVHFYDVRLP